MTISQLSMCTTLLFVSVLIVTLINTAQGNSPPGVFFDYMSTGGVKKMSEAAAIGTQIAHASVIDGDLGAEGDVNCELKYDEVFGLDATSSITYSIVLKKQLDREEEDMYNLQMTCYDHGTPPLSAETYFYVEVTDENDNAPVFTFPTIANDTVTIDTSKPLASATVTVTATDLDAGDNGQVVYSIPFNQHTDLFQMETNDNKGVLRVRRYPTDAQRQYTLVIKAADSGEQSMTTSADLNIIFTGAGAPATTTETTTKKGAGGQESNNCSMANILLVLVSNLLYFLL